MHKPPNNEKGRWEEILKHSDLLFTFGLFGTVILLVLPIAPFLMDLLLSFSIEDLYRNSPRLPRASSVSWRPLK